MKMFVTYLTTYSGSKLPKYYIGSTSEEKVLSGNYFGSIRSRKWKSKFREELKNNKHLFSIKILSYHDDRKSALEEELKIQIENNVVKSSDYMNESLAMVNGFFGAHLSGVNSPTYGKKFSKESRDKMSAAKKGKTYEEIYGEEGGNAKRKKMSEKTKGRRFGGYKKGTLVGENAVAYGNRHTEESKRKISEASSRTHRGKILSTETKNMLSELNKGERNPRYKNVDFVKIESMIRSGSSNSDICEEVGISITTLRRKFRAKYSISIEEYRNKL